MTFPDGLLKLPAYHKAIANFILSLNYNFSLRGYSMRELGQLAT